MNRFFNRNFASNKGALKGKKFPTKNTLPNKVIIQIEGKREFSDKQKLNKFINTKPALQEM